MKCDFCGKFIAYKDNDAMVYTDFGTSVDLVPPDERYICGKCWNGLSAPRKFFYTSPDYIWIPATKLFRCD